MPFYYVLSSTESSILEVDAPAAAAIRTALAGVAFTNAEWVGPAARITRRTVVGALHGFLTTVAWVLQVDGPLTQAGADAAALANANLVVPALAGLSSDWSTLAVTPYAPAVNGPLDWWQSGQASVTVTQDDFLTGAQRASVPDDNPVGPNSSAATPPAQTQAIEATGAAVGTAVGSVAAPLEQATTNVLTLVAVGAAVVAVVVFWPELTALLGRLRAGSTARARRPNARVRQVLR